MTIHDATPESGTPRHRSMAAARAAQAGASVALEAFRTEIPVETKGGKTDVVTQADRDAQRAVIEVLREWYPEDPIVGEEDDERKTVPAEGPAWIIDPIDGTSNFVRGMRTFGTAVAAVIDGEPVGSAVVLPALEDTYRAGPAGVTRNGEPVSVSRRTDPETCAVCPTIWWDFDERDQYARAAQAIVERFGDLRRFGCAQAVLSNVAEGALDGVLTNVRANPWDSVAGVHLVRTAGGTVTDLQGEPWRYDSTGLVVSNGEIHEDVLAAAQEIDG
ncbi:inositol monophosphatase family protein [Natrialbaceae archaeon A-CW2]|uniref:inositol monophosphatase family protein n=1 Tax=Natronosalvus amylolyticus TaxID=2961994 RepID=UPI0020CA01AE|nr:inositol monophosphatase family protein [Natronosalvus amylolyticus]